MKGSWTLEFKIDGKGNILGRNQNPMTISFVKDELDDAINIAVSIASIKYKDMKRLCKTERR